MIPGARLDYLEMGMTEGAMAAGLPSECWSFKEGGLEMAGYAETHESSCIVCSLGCGAQWLGRFPHCSLAEQGCLLH